ncbi:MAG: hypothetical protein KBA66_20030 [Leptospiraceae bacterium]|nr:hypothetical protein [Leptospiraceae bacterium]
MKEKFRELFSYFLPTGYRIKLITITGGVRLLSVILTLSIYNYVGVLIPKTIEYSLQITMVATIIISVILVVPLQEFLETTIKKKFLSEYLFDDPLTLKSARRRFEIDALISNVFPDMVKISGSTYGRLAVLIREPADYEVYTYSNGKRRKVKPKSVQIQDRLLKFLKDKKQGASTSDLVGLPDINNDFIELKANFIIPFIFRERLFGFLAVTEIPTPEDTLSLRILASKSALAVYNHILSSQVAIHKKYKREFEIANRIEDLIFTSKLPIFKSFKFETHQKDPSVLLEFFKNEDGEYLFILLVLNSTKVGSGLVSSHILGKMYSQSLLRRKHNLNSLRSIAEEMLKKLSWEEGYEMVVGSFREDTFRLTFSQTGKNFRITNDIEPDKSLISVGWRYTVDLNENPLVLIYYKSDKILSIKAI